MERLWKPMEEAREERKEESEAVMNAVQEKMLNRTMHSLGLDS